MYAHGAHNISTHTYTVFSTTQYLYRQAAEKKYSIHYICFIHKNLQILNDSVATVNIIKTWFSYTHTHTYRREFNSQNHHTRFRACEIRCLLRTIMNYILWINNKTEWKLSARNTHTHVPCLRDAIVSLLVC